MEMRGVCWMLRGRWGRADGVHEGLLDGERRYADML